MGLALGLVACSDRAAAPVDPLSGAWRVVSMHLVDSSGQATELRTHESLFTFAAGYYGMAYVFGDQRPAAYAERWHPTDAERIARFRSIIASSGTYTVTGSHLVARPRFALAPEFVGGRGEFAFEFAGDTLRLTWEKSIAFDGLEYPSAGTVTVLRLVRAD
jgi:hypothetical protein